MDEYIDILNSKGASMNKVELKSLAHKNGLWHASAQIWIINTKGEVLLQKRAANKDSYPNLWDISVAGHLTTGDTPMIAALREIKEEIGLVLEASQLQFLKKIKRSKIPKIGFLDNEFNYLYGVKVNFSINELKLQKEEVQSVQLISIKEFEYELNKNPNHFVPHGKTYYDYIISKLVSL